MDARAWWLEVGLCGLPAMRRRHLQEMHRVMNLVDIGNRSQIESAIAGALKATIDAHGPITRENRPSAAKRIYGELKSIARQQRDVQGVPTDEEWIAWADSLGEAAGRHMRHAIEYTRKHGDFEGTYE